MEFWQSYSYPNETQIFRWSSKLSGTGNLQRVGQERVILSPPELSTSIISFALSPCRTPGLLCWRHWLTAPVLHSTPLLVMLSFFRILWIPWLQKTSNSKVYFPDIFKSHKQLPKHFIWSTVLSVTLCLTVVTLQEFQRKKTKKKTPRGASCWTRNWMTREKKSN